MRYRKKIHLTLFIYSVNVNFEKTINSIDQNSEYFNLKLKYRGLEAGLGAVQTFIWHIASVCYRVKELTLVISRTCTFSSFYYIRISMARKSGKRWHRFSKTTTSHWLVQASLSKISNSILRHSSPLGCSGMVCLIKKIS